MNLKKLLLSTAALLATGLVATTTMTSCASVSQEIIDNMVDKGDSTMFANGVTIDKEFTNALTNETGYNAFKQKLVDDILYDWYKSNKDSQTSYKDNWTKWEKDAKTAYDDKVSSYKSNHKNDWEYYFQNEVLDPVGGTKDAFVRNEIVKNVRTAFTDAVFNTDDLKISQDNPVDERSPTVNTPSKQQLSDSANWNKIGFFSYNDPLFSNDDTVKLANQFAVIQNYVFEKYMAMVRPISTAMCLWKYAAPTAGMGSIYNTNKIPSGGNNSVVDNSLNDESTDISASYEYPAFAAPTSPISSTQVGNDLYYQFSAVWNEQHNFIDQNNGAINIDKSYTEDSATLMITEGNSAFSSLDISFAGAVSDLWNGYFGDGQNHINNNYLNAKLSVPSKYQDTDILSNFFFTNDQDKPTDKYSIDLSKLFEYDGNATLLKGDAFSSYLFNQNSSPYAKTTRSNGVRYVTPAVRLLDNSNNKLPFILIRDSFGVHVIGLDCASYITSQSDKWKAEANVLKFRSLNESLEYGNQGSGMTLKSKLKDYFTNNIDDVVLGIWGNKIQSHTKQTGDEKETIFKENLWGDGTFDYINNLVNAQNTYFNYYKILKTLDDANKKLFQNSSKYVKNDMFVKSGHITTDIYKNGLANALPFVLNNGNVIDALSEDSNLTTVSSTYTASNFVYGFDSNYLPLIKPTNDNISNLSKKDLDILAAEANNAIQSFWTHNAQPETSKEGMLKYSEHILIKREGGQDEDKWANDAINAAFNAFGGTDVFSNIVKYNAYTKYIQDTNASIETDYADEITGIYKSSSAITSDLPLTYYSSSNRIEIDQLKNVINNVWSANQYKSIETSGVQNYSSNAINYQLTLATLSWLTNNNNKELINRLQSDVSKGVSAAVVWYEKDLIPFNASFNTQCSNADDFKNIYGFNPNYLGMYDKTYQETDMTSDEPAMSRSYIEMSDYYHYATMPYYLTADNSISTLSPAMNFLGIQTSRSSSKMDTQVSDIIFNRNNQHLYDSVSSLHNPSAGSNGEGSLYQYGSRNELISSIEPSQDISAIKSYALNIRNCIPNNETFNAAVNLIDQGKDKDGSDLVTPQQYKDILLPLLRDENIIKDEMFKGFNFDDSQIGGVEIKNKLGGAAIRVEGSTYARAYMIQFCNRDLNSTADGDKYENITNHLVKIFGGQAAGKNILRSIAVQYAMNSDIQSKAISDIIKKVFNGKKITVYDRRFNDQLGQSWVADWKRTN